MIRFTTPEAGKGPLIKNGSKLGQLAGGTATVLTRVDGHGGRVRIGDDDWSARSFDGAQVIEPGEQVTVVRIAGATALVLAHHHSAG